MIRAVLFDVGGTLHEVHRDPALETTFCAQVLEKLPQAQPEAEEPPEWEDRTEELLTLIRKKYRKNLTDRPGIEKTTAALYRRGYPLDEIRTAMKMILEQEENDCDD